VSDLHFEQCKQHPGSQGYRPKFEYYEWPQPKWPAAADYLILAGDIGNISDDYDALRDFLEMRCSQYKLVFLVLGNHEFRNRIKRTTIEEGLTLAGKLESDSRMGGKLRFLNNNRYDLKAEGAHISILGCTLWTKIRADQEKHLDGRPPRTLEGIPGNSTRHHTERFNQSFKWLQDEVKKIRSEADGHERKILVITHYTPFIRGASRDNSSLGNPLKRGYSHYVNDILGGCGLEGLGVGDMWVYGHTHHSTDLVVDEVRVFSNQRGSKCPPLIVNPDVHDFDITRVFSF
jgi:predicted phosphodiesterase